MDPSARRLPLPVHALSEVFRGKYLDALHHALRDDSVVAPLVPFRGLWQPRWVVYAKKPFAGPRQVLDYLARYTHRVALTNNRLLGLRDSVVRMRWRDYAHGGRKKILALQATDLLGRFVRHVLPRGFRRVRHYGLLGNRHKTAKLAGSRRYFGIVPPADPTPVEVTHRLLRRLGIEPNCCPACGSRRVVREPIPSRPLVPRARAPTATSS